MKLLIFEEIRMEIFNIVNSARYFLICNRSMRDIFRAYFVYFQDQNK